MSVSLNELDSHLFECADIIRDAVDSRDYKEFILPLVFYKAVSDEFDVQYQENIDEFGEEEFARESSLCDIPVVPEGYLWGDIRAVNDNVNKAHNDAFDALDDDRLGKLVEHLSTPDLDRDSVPPTITRFRIAVF